MNTARFFFVLAGALAVAPLSLGAQAGQEDSAPTPQVRTAATAERSVQADLATVILHFSAEGATPSEAGRKVAAQADTLRRALGTLGIPHDSLVNRSRWYWWRGRIEAVPQPVRYVQRDTPTRRYSEAVQDTIYRAHETIEVRIRDLRKVGAVLDTAMGRGITDISNVQFTATSVTAAQEDALREATTSARRQADAIATASGMALGPVLSLSSQPGSRYDYSPVMLRGTTAAALSGGEVGTVIVQPSIPIAVTVYGTWQLVKKP
jgi:uncharacterized protein YggE